MNRAVVYVNVQLNVVMPRICKQQPTIVYQILSRILNDVQQHRVTKHDGIIPLGRMYVFLFSKQISYCCSLVLLLYKVWLYVKTTSTKCNLCSSW